MPETEKKRTFFMRARTRILTRWGAISILAALVVLGMAMTDDPVVAVAPPVEAVWRPRNDDAVKEYPQFDYFRGNQRDIFVFKDPPRPKVVEPIVITPPKPEPRPVEPVKEPEPPSVDTSGLTLKGVIADTAGGGWAIISGLGKYDQVKRRGDKVRGAVIERILPDRIIVRKDKITGELRLRRSFTTFVPKNVKKVVAARENERQAAPVAAPRRRRRLGISVRSRQGIDGLIVTRVRRDDIDVRRGDILRAIDGEPVTSMSRAIALIRKTRTRKTVTLQLSRAGRDFSVRVPMEE